MEDADARDAGGGAEEMMKVVTSKTEAIECLRRLKTYSQSKSFTFF